MKSVKYLLLYFSCVKFYYIVCLEWVRCINYSVLHFFILFEESISIYYKLKSLSFT